MSAKKKETPKDVFELAVQLGQLKRRVEELEKRVKYLSEYQGEKPCM